MGKLLPILTVALAVMLAGCGDSGDPGRTDAGQTAVTHEALDGSTFTATEARGFKLDPEVPLTISFEQKTLSVDAGCNSIGGAYRIRNGEIKGMKLFSTLMGCPSPLDEIETETTRLLTDGAAATLEGGTLTLDGEDGTGLTLER